MENTEGMRFATLSNVDEIYNLMQSVYNALDNKSLFVCDDKDYIASHIEKKGFTVVACDGEDRIIACFIVRFPGGENDNLGRDIGLKDADLSLVAHMESAVVSPEFRGNHLQYRMLKFAEAQISRYNRDEKRFRYLMATVSADNPASYKTLEKAGYRAVAVKEKYGGLSRRIYCKKI